MTKVTKLLAEFKKNNLLEDRREYGPEDFQSTYGLSKKEAKMLYLKVQRLCKNSDKKKRITVRR